MTAGVQITVEDALEHVLTIPITAIIGAAEMGEKRECFVMTPHGPEKREIELGMSNEKVAEVRSGLIEGDEVVTNPKVLVGDKVKTRQPGEYSNAQQEKGPGEWKGKGARKGGPAKAGGGPEAAAPAREGRGPRGGGQGAMNRAGGEGAMPSPEQMKKMREDMIARYKPATPEKRKEMLQQVPEQFRDQVRQSLKTAGIDIPEE
jgi:hypothetical protein